MKSDKECRSWEGTVLDTIDTSGKGAEKQKVKYTETEIYGADKR